MQTSTAIHAEAYSNRRRGNAARIEQGEKHRSPTRNTPHRGHFALQNNGVSPAGGRLEQFREAIRKEIEVWRKVVSEAGVKAE